MEKLHQYQGFYGQLHHIRDLAKQKLEKWKEDNPKDVKGIAMKIIRTEPRGPPDPGDGDADEFSHIYRTKTRSELVRISAAVMGIEFSYAAETAFVSPTLLKIGVRHQHMTMVWALSPVLGFFITPVLGSLSDGCRSSLGRRRPFILLLALGVLLGLVLVPNGEDLGHALGDVYPSRDLSNNSMSLPPKNLVASKVAGGQDVMLFDSQYSHPWGVFFTVLGTVLLDFDADSCQSPARAYLLDVTLPEDHAKGLSTFTVMAGFGGFFGYALGGVNWDATVIGEYLGGHVRAVFTFITVIFIFCVLATITAFKEIPLDVLTEDNRSRKLIRRNSEERLSQVEGGTYGATKEGSPGFIFHEELKGFDVDSLAQETPLDCSRTKETETSASVPSMKEYLLSIIFMPKSLRMVCLTNLFCWMSHVCYSLYFTDFVGEAVFNGNPSAPVNSEQYESYQEGVRFGCWGMSMYSLSCSCYSLIIEALIKKFRAKRVYIGGLLFYSVGMSLMAFTKNKIGVILFSWTAGVMYSTLFTMPYLLVAHYHASGVFGLTKSGEAKTETRLRGLGTDVAIVSSMVFLAQFILALCMGSIVSWAGTTTSVVSVASLLAFCGAITAFKITYLDL